MTDRLLKKVYNDEKGVRRLGFYAPVSPNTPLVSFDLNVLEDAVLHQGEDAVARMIYSVLNVLLEGTLTQEELEWAVEDI